MVAQRNRSSIGLHVAIVYNSQRAARPHTYTHTSHRLPLPVVHVAGSNNRVGRATSTTTSAAAAVRECRRRGRQLLRDTAERAVRAPRLETSHIWPAVARSTRKTGSLGARRRRRRSAARIIKSCRTNGRDGGRVGWTNGRPTVGWPGGRGRYDASGRPRNE